MVETSSNPANSRYASAESLNQFSTTDHFTRMKVSDRIYTTNDEKSRNSHLQLQGKLSLVCDFAAVDVWGESTKY